MHTLRIQEAGSVTLTAEEVQRATRDIASTPAPQALPFNFPVEYPACWEATWRLQRRWMV